MMYFFFLQIVSLFHVSFKAEKLNDRIHVGILRVNN